MTAIPPIDYETNEDGFMPPAGSGGTLAYKSVAFDFNDTEVVMELPEGAVVVLAYTSLSTVFNGSDPSMTVDLSGTALTTVDLNNAHTLDVSAKPKRGTLLTLTIDGDSSSAGAGHYVVIYAVM